MTHESLPERIDALEGLVTPTIGRTLYRYARSIPADQAIVELGSYKGKSTSYLAAGAASVDGAHVWAVDPWDLAGNESGRFGFATESTRLAFLRQVESVGLADRVTQVQSFSVPAGRNWDGPKVGLLYVDGDHSYRAVKGDVAAWWPHLTPDALVIFDDYCDRHRKGVVRAVDEMVGRGTIGLLHAGARLAITRRAK